MVLIADKKVSKRHGLFLMILAVSAFTILTIFNLKTIKFLSAMRAYISEDSHSSKAQRDGVRYLLAFIETGNSMHYDLFIQKMAVPLSSSRAFHGLLEAEADSVIIKSFLNSGVELDDAQSIIWFYRSFQAFSFMKNSFDPWQKADSLRYTIIALG